MATLQVIIPDEIKARFEQTFSGKDIDSMIVQMMRDALDQAGANQRERRAQAIAELLALRRQTLPVSEEAVREARGFGLYINEFLLDTHIEEKETCKP
jgi:hypothetical protein